MLETADQYHIHMFVVATTHVCKLLLQRISNHTDALSHTNVIK